MNDDCGDSGCGTGCWTTLGCLVILVAVAAGLVALAAYISRIV